MSTVGGVSAVHLVEPVLVTGGTGADPLQVTLVAAQPLNAYKVIASDANGKAIYGDAGNLATKDKVIGIASTAANTGDTLSVQYAGEITNSGWSWTPGSLLFVGLGGEVTTQQVGLYSQAVGFARTATTVFIRVGRTILRS